MDHKNRDTPYHLAGWILFVVCSLLFLSAAFRDGDLVLGLASVVFLTGCVAFLIPLLAGPPEREKVVRREGDDSPAEET